MWGNILLITSNACHLNSLVLTCFNSCGGNARGRFERKDDYFPIQNFPNIVPSISRSVSTCPVISPK